MKKNIASFLRTTLAASAIIVAAASCQKANDATPSLQLNNTTAATPAVASPVQVIGKYGNANPGTGGGPGTYGTVYVALTGTSLSQDSTGTFTGANLLFTSYNNSFIGSANSNNHLYFIQDANLDFADVDASDFSSGDEVTFGTTIGLQSTGVRGYYTYGAFGVPQEIPGSYFMLSTPAGNTFFYVSDIFADGGATFNRGRYEITWGL